MKFKKNSFSTFVLELRTNIYHRNTAPRQPANLLCDTNWSTYVGDFGFSRIKAELRTMTRCGTLFYSAPELLEGNKYGVAVDVYAFGIVLGEMVQRAKPYLSHRNVGKQQQGSIAYMISREGLRPDSDLHALPARRIAVA